MSLNRVAGPASSAARCRHPLLWLVVAILLPFLLSQVLPDQTDVNPVSGLPAAWEDAEDGASGNLDQSCRITTIGHSCVVPALSRLPGAGAVVTRPIASRQMSYFVAPSPRGPPEGPPERKNGVSNHGRAPPHSHPFYAKAPHHLSTRDRSSLASNDRRRTRTARGELWHSSVAAERPYR